jgi:5S rRNA maturation endonuclease (ribonuclease M5)
MKTMTQKFHSYNQQKLKVVCDQTCDNIEELLTALDIPDYKMSNKMITMSCPIHGGDNASAINIYHTGDYYRGNWKCRTHNCDDIFKSSIIGFVRGVLSRTKYGWTQNGDPTASFQEAVDFCLSLLNKSIKDIKISRSDTEKTTFARIVENVKQSTTSANPLSKITKAQVRQSLQIPANYYLSRGYTKEVLNKYDVGLCDNPKKEMHNRIVVPVYSIDGKYIIGCTGRSIFNSCSKCKNYHNPDDSCPSKEDAWKYCKWKHNFGFKSQEHLYNFWFAKDHIQKTKNIILVESPGNVWRLEEAGIHNSVAIFGSSMSDKQKLLIDSSGAMNIILLMDNDDAGQKACKQITEKCKKIYRIYSPTFDGPDVGELSVDEIKNSIIPQISSIK